MTTHTHPAQATIEPAHGKATKIYLNGEDCVVEQKSWSFEELTKLAFPNLVITPGLSVTITYRRGVNQPEKSLSKGESVQIKEGMVINVVSTSKS